MNWKLGVYRIVIIGLTLGLYSDSEKQNGNYSDYRDYIKVIYRDYREYIGVILG